VREPQLGDPDHFPALPTSAKKEKAPPAPSGYAKPCIKYTRETIVAVIEEVAASNPPPPALDEDCPIMSKNAVRETLLMDPLPM
jgi:hypothetical protein